MPYRGVGMTPRDMITGPGNAFVAEAKRQLFGTVGPTEIVVIANETADPALVATASLGQAEHGPDSLTWLLTTSRRFGELVTAEIAMRLETLPTAAIAGNAWEVLGEVIVVDSDDEAALVSDEYAPEHLELSTARDDCYLGRLTNYGSLFIGEQATVAYGDKGVGTNHTLPTGTAGCHTGGVSGGKVIKSVTWQRLSDAASRRIAPIMGRICLEEGMLAHERTAAVRFARYAPKNDRDCNAVGPREACASEE